MPKTDVERLNAPRPKPKPSENPPETVRTPSDDGADPMEVDKRNSGGIVRDLEVQIGNALVPVDFQVFEIKRPARPSAELDQSCSADGRAGSNTRPARPSAELDESRSADGQAGSTTRPSR
ncbi:hypothetical protein F2Q69_00013742 [Brassica cretica]|uniref:Uncharacterized protein n=1 Tax=Brassica cretica TaxID=69181 RepID=A0A8S9QRV0_BRACR|nr:hypothetical protein F2Q69_00013742 [Brassica cretica]